jgi:hypothetical protein
MNQSNDTTLTIIVAVIGIGLIAWGWTRAATNTGQFEPDPELVKKYKAEQGKPKGNMGGMAGMFSAE